MKEQVEEVQDTEVNIEPLDPTAAPFETTKSTEISTLKSNMTAFPVEPF